MAGCQDRVRPPSVVSRGGQREREIRNVLFPSRERVWVADCEQVTSRLAAVSQRCAPSHKMPFLPSLPHHQGTISLSSCLLPNSPSAEPRPPPLPVATTSQSYPAFVCLQATPFSGLRLLNHVSTPLCRLGPTTGTTPGPGMDDKSFLNPPQPNDEATGSRHGDSLPSSRHLRGWSGGP